MKSVGEVMAIGRTFPEALNKALRGLEIGNQGSGIGDQGSDLSVPTAQRIFAVLNALRSGATLEEVVAQTKYDPWFVAQMQAMIDVENELRSYSLETLPIELLRRAKRMGFSDKQIAASCCNQQSAISNQQSRSSASLSQTASFPPTTASIPAPPNSKRSRPTCIPPTNAATKPRRRTTARSSSSAADRIASGKASSSITAACRRVMR